MFFIFIENAMICWLFSLIFLKNLCSFMFITIIVIVVIYSFVQIMFTTWPHVAKKKERCCKACSPNVAKNEQSCKACLPNVAKHWGQCCKACSPNVAKNEHSCKACLPHVAKHWEQCWKTCLPNVAKHLNLEQCCKACSQNVAKHSDRAMSNAAKHCHPQDICLCAWF